MSTIKARCIWNTAQKCYEKIYSFSKLKTGLNVSTITFHIKEFTVRENT